MGDRKAAIEQFNFGSEQFRLAREGKGDLNLAYQLYASSALNDSTMAMSWHELGNVLDELQLSAAALAAHRRAIELPDGITPGDISPQYRAKSMVQLAYRLHVLGRNEEASDIITDALKMDARSPQAWCVSSLVNSMLGLHGAAVDNAKRAHELDPINAVVETALALNLMFAGQLKEGLKHFEARYRYKLKHFLTFPYPQWKGEEGKAVYLVADQGIGDTLSFARFLRQAAARCKFMYVGAQKELVRLFKASFQDIPNIEIGTPNANGWPPADYWTSFVSLPTALDLSEEQIRAASGIKIPQFQVSRSWKSPDRKHHIAVAWRGSKNSDIDHHRSFPVENLLRLYEIDGVQLYSIQVGEEAKELHTAGCAALIRDLSPFINDVADTTAILRDVDLVVSVESAPAHIAGACGVRTIIPYSHAGNDYRIGRDGENIIWYPNHSIVKQYENETWHKTFDRVVQAVRKQLNA